ncbi:MliC family protein [Lysobacter sp. 5GHs7-4]|uniref:MliC family protein n=1 Tax=Lysobacter sp. 5GHs7-4 TaxID=2904253 RepID=UPI001E4BC598|nr:MliC family protein [Lysobacter sp. 5GHs7-4]UHQ21866.1 MliC family protein [Lysobacter sp. 5GHs7-4]
MHRIACLAATAVLLTACQPKPAAEPTTPAATATTAPAASSANNATTAVTIDKAAPPALSPPSFDCAKAQSEAETLVCNDAELAALDRQLAKLWADTQARPNAPASETAKQRGWVKGRDECWKAEDKHRCVRESYQVRIVELNLLRPDVTTPPAVSYDCGDQDSRLSAVYYNDFEPKAVVLTWAGDRAIALQQPSASGTHYAVEGVDFSEHQGTATLDFFGTSLSCKPVK